MGSLKSDEQALLSWDYSKEAILYVNGVRKVIPDGLAHFTLLEYLRGLLGLFTMISKRDKELTDMVYSQRENNARIFQLSNEIGNFKQGTQTLRMYYARLRSSWEELSHYDSFIEWPAREPSENVPILPMTSEIYAKIVEKTQVFQFLGGLNPDFEYARVHLLDKTPFPTLEEAHTYCISDQSRRSPMPPISGIPSETSAMVVRYAYPVPPSVPSQTSHTSSPSLYPLPAASGNSRPSRKKCDYCGKWGHLKTTCHSLHGRPTAYQPRPSQSSTHLSVDSSVPDSSAFSAFSKDEINSSDFPISLIALSNSYSNMISCLLLYVIIDIGLTGTKLGCGEGGCGACTVMVSYYDEALKKSV
ncbi:hypothetical protein GIB67_040130 [Kingdonia uniflora]|uniref:2Fe-2S ferredoxin-type domain-containing protein n=1 Tax=Kingdonia uniflora TaxID=39325 RepID=A0A7J7MUQ3_9MAGN|nr:hypothetical protein GIB67_040130 [Kingdonia uniflora]